MLDRIKLYKVINVLNSVITAEDTTNKLANKLKEARDPLYEMAEALELAELELEKEESHG